MKTPLRLTHFISFNILMLLLQTNVFASHFKDGGDKTNEYIEWTHDSKLTWKNFKAMPSDDDAVFAFASTDIDCEHSCDDETLHFQVNAIFYENESWAKLEAQNSLSLIWQQLSFDLTALYSYKLSKILSKHKYSCADDEKFNNTVSKVKFDWQMKQMKLQKDALANPENYKHIKKWARIVHRNLNDFKEV